MASLNRVQLIGNVGSTPELRYTPGAMAVANFSVATNKIKKNKEGEKKEHTEWHKIIVWDKLAEVCAKHLTKGSQVFIEGEIQSRTYEDKDKITRTAYEIVADSMLMLGKGKDKPAEAETAEAESESAEGQE